MRETDEPEEDVAGVGERFSAMGKLRDPSFAFRAVDTFREPEPTLGAAGVDEREEMLRADVEPVALDCGSVV